MEPKTLGEHQKLLTEVIKKQIVILGPDITLAKARNVAGLIVADDGTVTAINGDPQLLTKELVNQFMELSGLIVKKTMEPLLSVADTPATPPAPTAPIPPAPPAQAPAPATPPPSPSTASTSNVAQANAASPDTIQHPASPVAKPEENMPQSSQTTNTPSAPIANSENNVQQSKDSV